MRRPARKGALPAPVLGSTAGPLTDEGAIKSLAPSEPGPAAGPKNAKRPKNAFLRKF